MKPGFLSHTVMYGGYPAIMVLSIGLHSMIHAQGTSLLVATYIPIVVGAIAVTLLEWQCPHRREWWASKIEILQDSIFMAVIQAILPKFLSFIIALTMLKYFAAHDLALEGWWPTEWPVAGQVLLMIFTADFFRYWLHRIAHEWEGLWRFHAVHHSPHKLYWLNVGRFHPVDKSLQFLFDALPFILLGVSAQVLGMYMVCYAINGFFQHCNVELRLGLLNYLVSGPELHRWHHSQWKEESNHNYGNNVIVWDLVFGTYYLPKDKLVGDLGLLNRQYPASFVEQLKTPFIPGLDKRRT